MKSIKITKVDHLHDFILKLTFSDGKFQEVDFRPFLENAQHPEIAKYLDINFFMQYELVDGDIIWNDYDLVFPIWDLYSNSLTHFAKNAEEAS
jgi:hypothetical protein